MPLIVCPDCGKKVSSEATTCPECGRPINQQIKQTQPTGGRKCPYCGAQTVGRIRGLQGKEILVAIPLFFLLLIPGIVYYIYLESIPYCSGCGKRVHK